MQVHKQERARDCLRLRRRGRWLRQFSNTVFVERRLRLREKAKRLRIGFSFRWPDDRVRAASGRALLSLPISRAAAAGIGSKLRTGGRARCPSRNCRTIQANEAIKLILGVGEPL